MKKTSCLVLICLFSAASLLSCDKRALDSDKSKVSYGIGLQFANDIKSRNIDLDIKAFRMAVEDVFSGRENRISDDELKMAFQTYSQTLMKSVKRNRKRT